MLLVVALVPTVGALFFSLGPKANECFSLLVAEQRSSLVGSFEATGAREGLWTTIKNAEDKEVWSSKAPHGEINLKTKPGKFRVCFASQVAKPQVLSFDLRARSDFAWDLDTDKAATKKETDKVDSLVQRLLDRVMDVQDQQHHAITREQIYRATADSTHDRVVWWTVVKVAVLGLTSLSQVWYLRSLFEVKQIIYLLLCFTTLVLFSLLLPMGGSSRLTLGIA